MAAVAVEEADTRSALVSFRRQNPPRYLDTGQRGNTHTHGISDTPPRFDESERCPVQPIGWLMTLVTLLERRSEAALNSGIMLLS